MNIQLFIINGAKSFTYIYLEVIVYRASLNIFSLTPDNYINIKQTENNRTTYYRLSSYLYLI